jgi:hypothetical protein
MGPVPKLTAYEKKLISIYKTPKGAGRCGLKC